jgi:TIR domain
MAGKIFISYRRDDSRYQARMIYEAFVRGLPRENVFMDIDTIPLGVNFVKVLESWVEQCEVLLVLIGADWVNSTDPKTGKRRLDNPRDFVRVEIRGALTRDIPSFRSCSMTQKFPMRLSYRRTSEDYCIETPSLLSTALSTPMCNGSSRNWA